MKARTGPVKLRARGFTLRRSHSENKSARSAEHWTSSRRRIVQACLDQRGYVVNRVCCKHRVSIDVVEDCFVRALHKVCKMDSQFLDAIDDTRAYMYVGTMMELRSELRTKRNRVPHVPLHHVFSVPDNSHLALEQTAITREALSRVLDTLEALPKDQFGEGPSILMAVAGGCSYAEVGKKLNISEGAVRHRVFRIRRGLAQNLPEDLREYVNSLCARK